jgi:hypothetical protein
MLVNISICSRLSLYPIIFQVFLKNDLTVKCSDGLEPQSNGKILLLVLKIQALTGLSYNQKECGIHKKRK